MRISDWSSDVCSPEQFRAIAKRHHATLLMVCPNMPESTVYRARSPGGFYDQLAHGRSEEHTSELQSLMRISYAVFCLKKKKKKSKHIRDVLQRKQKITDMM